MPECNLWAGRALLLQVTAEKRSLLELAYYLLYYAYPKTKNLAVHGWMDENLD